MKTKFQKGNFNLTSVKIITTEYKTFKTKCIDTGISLQEFVNSCVYLYNRDNDFIKTIHQTILSGSIL